MRRPAPDARPVALTLAGSDSGGGAGIQADLKTMEAHGAFGTSAVTAVTAQHTRGVERSHVLPTEEVAAQLDAVRSDFDVRAAKTGMLAVAEVVDLAAGFAADADAPVVVDPVMVATSGDRLLDPAAESAYEDLCAAATLVTPNAEEAEVLTDVAVTDAASAAEAGHELLSWGAEAALVKGGHLAGDQVVDVYVTDDGVREFTHARVDTAATHGSGCTLSAAVTARLARGDEPGDAVAGGLEFMERAVRYHLDVGRGPGPVHHMAGVRNRASVGATVESVESVVTALVDAGATARTLVPPVGLSVAGATRFAERANEVAAVEGRVARTATGLRPNRGVRLGADADAPLVQRLLAVRERRPGIAFAANCRHGDVLTALDAAGVPWADVESDDPAAVAGAVAAREATVVAVADAGGTGRPPEVSLFAADADALAADLLELASEV